MLKPKTSIKRRTYPEIDIVGISRVDGTHHFYSRIHEWLRGRPVQAILDVGCGRGASFKPGGIRDFRNYATVIGIDRNVEWEHNWSIHDYRGINPDGTWPIETVGCVFSDYVVEHVEDVDHFFREASRVLMPGGLLALRTPNRWCYPSILAQIIPNRYHHKFLKRPKQDVFPTVYRANTVRKLKRLLKDYGFTGSVYTIEVEPTYITWRWLYRVMAVVHRWIPSMFQSTIIVFAIKQ